MGLLVQSNFYRDRNFGILLWEGNKGDVLEVRTTEPAKRADLAFFSVVARGGLRMLSPSGEELWRYSEGSTSAEGGDFVEPGAYTWEALEDGTQELCISTVVPETGEISDAPFDAQVQDVSKGARASVPAGSLIIVSRGLFDTKLPIKEPLLQAPHFSRVDNDIVLYALEDSRLVVIRP